MKRPALPTYFTKIESEKFIKTLKYKHHSSLYFTSVYLFGDYRRHGNDSRTVYVSDILTIFLLFVCNIMVPNEQKIKFFTLQYECGWGWGCGWTTCQQTWANFSSTNDTFVEQLMIWPKISLPDILMTKSKIYHIK